MTKVLFLTLLFLLCVPKVFAQQGEEDIVVPSLPPVVTIAPTPPDYPLPYPGLLPNNPLYPFKAFRDKMISLLVGDPLKKAEFDLLQADKRLNAAVSLRKMGDDESTNTLIISTISKGENYFEEAISKTEESKREGVDATQFAGKLQAAAVKHKAVMKELQNKSNEKTKKNIQPLLQRMDAFVNRVVLLVPKVK